MEFLGGGDPAYCTYIGNSGRKETIAGSNKKAVRMATTERRDEYCRDENVASQTCKHRNLRKMNQF